MQIVAVYAASAVALFALDFIWLSLAVPRLYRPLLGDLLAAQPNLLVAALFYLVYVVGIVVFAVLPAASGSWLTAAGLGALLGLVAYGTYDFTNLATVRGWPVAVTVIDVTWGIVVSAVSALVGYAVMRWLG